MDEQSKPESGAEPSISPDRNAALPDLSFLWPLLDRIRGVEITFHGDGGSPPPADVEARLKALEDEVAALGKTLRETFTSPTLRETIASSTPGVRASTATSAAPLLLQSQSRSRAVSGAVTAVLLLLLAHVLVVFVFDLPTFVLRLVSIAIPLPIAIWMTLRRRIQPWLEVAMAVAIGLIAVGGMSYVTGLHEHTSFLPEDRREWRETFEYVASIAFAYGTGVLISAALQARSGAENRAGQVTLRLAQVIVTVTGKLVTTGPEIKKRVDLIQTLINATMLLATAVTAVVTGLRSAIH